MRNYVVYTDESGLTPDEGYILYGMLFIPTEVHAEIHTQLKLIFAKAKGGARKSRNNFLMKLIKNKDIRTIQKLLQDDKNAFEMKFSNINEINFDTYKDFVDIIKRPDVKYCTYVVDKKLISPKITMWEFFVNKYSDALSTHISSLFNEGDSFFIMCDELSTPKHAEKLFEDQLKSKIEYRVRKKGLNRLITGITTISSHASLFCQICDLLLGSVTAKMKVKQKLGIKRVKVRFSMHINRMIGLHYDFCSSFTCKKSLFFKVQHIKSQKK